ncbi:TolC family protein [Dyadobacter sp. CY312]|uniref:TolC family protein n=1 Tax=Dyadobacter sp. CY312 TaxID=2907303 RepID=UPI001F1B6C51|nr:TolC family protein [Dyadobacter sp. CY312]MCE7041131.1 TolC family protein [Dyadobacter sp. CY312]
MINKILLLITILPLFAQAQKSDVLENYVEEGLQNNLSLHQESLEIKKAMEVIRQAKALFYPRLSFNPTYSYAAGGRRLNFPVGDLLNPAYKSLNELTGTNQFPTNIENVNELLAPTNFHDTKVNVQYSIYNPEIKYNYLIQKSLLSAQEAKKKVVENELRYNIETAYYQYLQSLEAVKILDNSAAVLGELVKLNKKLVANNTATKDVVFSSEYEASKLVQQKIEAGNNSRVARAYFNFLLNRDLANDIIIDSTLINADMIDFGGGDQLTELKEKAKAGRGELKQFDMSIEAARHAITLQQKAASLPSLFVGGNAGFQGYGYTFKNQAYMIMQAGLQWDIFKGFERKSKIQQAKIQADLLQTKKTDTEKQIELQTTQAYYDFVSAGEAQKASHDGMLNASQYFKVVDSRYRNGNLLLIEYIKAQNDVQTARLQQVITKYDVLIKRSVLDKITVEP